MTFSAPGPDAAAPPPLPTDAAGDGAITPQQRLAAMRNGVIAGVVSGIIWGAVGIAYQWKFPYSTAGMAPYVLVSLGVSWATGYRPSTTLQRIGAAGVALAYVVATYIRYAHLVRVGVEHQSGVAALEDYGYLSVRTIGPAVTAALHKCFVMDLVMAAVGVAMVVYNLRPASKSLRRARERLEARRLRV